MKINKRIIALALSLVLVTGMSLTASAASGINQNEQAILDSLSGSVEVNGKTMSMPANYINQARNYLMLDDVDLTKSVSDQVVGLINATWTLVESYELTGVTGFHNVPSELMTKILANVQEAADILGLTISISFEGSGKPVITIVSSTSAGKIGDSGKAIKQTGISFLSTVIVFILLTGILGYCVLNVKRNHLVIEG